MGPKTKIFTALMLAAVGCALLFADLAYSQPGGEGESIELIVRPDDGKTSPLQQTLRSGTVSKQTADSLFANVTSISSVFDSRGTRQKNGEGTLPIPAFRLGVRDSASFRRLRTRMRQHADVRYAHENVSFRVNAEREKNRSLFPPDDPILRDDNALADSLDHLDVIHALDAWSVTSGTTDVRIGVVDTGIFLEHPDLADQFSINEAEDVNGNGKLDPIPVEEGGDLNGVDDDGNGYVDDVVGYDFVDRPSAIQSGEFADRDPDPSADLEEESSGHGTAVAGVATAAPDDVLEGIAGVAPDARLVALRAFGRDGTGRADDIAAAIMYGAENELDVLNLSFGQGRAVPLIEDAIEYAVDQGTVVVASAGNELTDDPHYPSDYPEVVSVVWLGEDGMLPQVNQSQFGIGVDLGAPGSNVFTADLPADKLRADESPELEDLYGPYSGSSFSAPQVAGAAALLRSADSSLSPASIRSILTAAADDIKRANWDHETGAGLLNVEQSLMRAYPARTEITAPEHNHGVEGDSSLAITGTAIDPAFDHYAVYYAKGTRNLGQRRDPWVEITPPTSRQVLRDTLGVWSTQALSELKEGEYTLRLVTTFHDDRTIEDRRRIRIDRSQPEVRVEFIGVGRVEGENGIVADVESDDVTRVRMEVQIGNRGKTVLSESKARRHGLTWPDETGNGGQAAIQLDATNSSGLTTTTDTTLHIPASNENTGLLTRTSPSLSPGKLLSTAVNFDGDELSEILLNQFKNEGRTDTLRTFEWTGSDFAPADTLVTADPFVPRDAGDTNGDGLQELLLQREQKTLLLEQPNSTAPPTDLIFADTSRVSDAPGDTLNGARLTDLDADGQGEVIGTRQKQWKVLERKPSGFQEIARLTNPTDPGPDSSRGNRLTTQAATGDFDGDGRRDLLVGDQDGDLIVYEATGDDQIETAWTVETDRQNAEEQFAVGDFTGTGRTNFATVTTTSGAPSISYYSVWQRAGEDAYERAFRLPIPSALKEDFSRQNRGGLLESADLDRDGRSEIVIAHPPSLLVLDRSASGAWQVLYEDRSSSISLDSGMLAADVSGTGTPSILTGTNEEKMARYAVDPAGLAVAPPRWVRARPGGASSTKLTWRAPGVDSVTVYGRPASDDSDLAPIVTTTDSSTTLDGKTTRRYRLKAWKEGAQSPFSPARPVRPHPPATVDSVSYPGPSTVEIQFAEVLAPDLQVEQFQFGAEDTSPERLVRAQSGQAVILRFSRAVAGQSGQLSWSGIVDATGLDVDQTAVNVSFPADDRRSLFIEEAMIVGENRARLAFNAPLDPSAARERDRYTLRPRGRVADVQVEGDSSDTVVLHVEGLVLGASGEESSLTVTEMVGADGRRLSDEGGTVRLTRPADDLSNVFVYPNPYRAAEHGEKVEIAGLPPEATIRIYTPGGRLVRELSARTRDGGRDWNLRDRRGERVPSGVYLFRVNAPEQSPVLEKAAVIR